MLPRMPPLDLDVFFHSFFRSAEDNVLRNLLELEKVNLLKNPKIKAQKAKIP